MMKSLSALLVATFSLVALAGQASAATWSTPASGCVLRPSDQQKADLDPISGRLQFADGKSGTIKVTCPISGSFLSHLFGNEFWVTFADGDGFGSNCNLWANLMAESNGTTTALQELAGVSASVSPPNSQYANTTNRQQTFDFFSHFWDTETWNYWVIIEIARNPGATCNVTVFSTGLTDVIE